MLVLDGPPKGLFYDVTFSPDGETIAACERDGRIFLWQGSSEAFGPLETTVVRFRPGTDQLYYALEPSSFGWHDVRTSESGGGEVTFEASVTGLAFVGPDRVAIGTGNRSKPYPGSLYVWDIARRSRTPNSFAEPAGVRTVTANPEGHTVAWATHGPRARVSVWDITTASPFHLPVSHVSPSLAFHPDGQTMAAAVDYGVKLFDLPTRAERRTLKGHTGRVMGVAFSPDGRVLASGSWDGTVRLWDAATGTELARYAWPTGRVFALAYAPDGLRLAAAGDKGCVVVWDTE